MKIKATVIKSVTVELDIPKPKNRNGFTPKEIDDVQERIHKAAKGEFNSNDPVIHDCSRREFIE